MLLRVLGYVRWCLGFEGGERAPAGVYESVGASQCIDNVLCADGFWLGWCVWESRGEGYCCDERQNSVCEVHLWWNICVRKSLGKTIYSSQRLKIRPKRSFPQRSDRT
jgi:hypothetical protein